MGVRKSSTSGEEVLVAVKESEEKVKAERSKLAADIDKSRQGLNKGEGELEFKCVAYFHTMTSQILGAANIDLLSLQDDVSRRNTRPTGTLVVYAVSDV